MFSLPRVFKNMSQKHNHLFSMLFIILSYLSPVCANEYLEKIVLFFYIYKHFKFCSSCQENDKGGQFATSHTLVLAASLSSQATPAKKGWVISLDIFTQTLFNVSIVCVNCTIHCVLWNLIYFLTMVKILIYDRLLRSIVVK